MTAAGRTSEAPAPAHGTVDTVVVDYGGVLTNPLAETLDLFARRVDVDVATLAGAFVEAARELGESPMAALETGAISEQQMVGRLLTHLPPGLGARLDGQPFGELWFEGRRPNAPFLDFMRQLKASGYRLALLTNNVREWEGRWRAQIPVDELFTLVVNSAHEGVRKPDPRIYRVLLDRLDTAASQCLFVDDDIDNCAAARDVGMNVVRFTTTEDAIHEMRAVLRQSVPWKGPAGVGG